MKKIMLAVIIPLLLPIIILILIIGGGNGGQNGLAASAANPSKIAELLSLKAFGIPYDLVMMIASYPCKTQKEAEEARFIFIAMDFMVVTEQVEQIVCICDPPEPTPEDPEPEGECTCGNWEVVGHNTYSGREQLLGYLGITEDEKTINCVSVEASLKAAALAKETSDSKYAIISITSVEPTSFESIITANNITDKNDIKGIIELYDKAYFIEWLDSVSGGGGDVGTVPDIGGKYVMPVSGAITCSYGWRIHPITGNRDFHTGVDIGSPKHAHIVSVYDGIVQDIGVSPYDGRYVLIYHPEDDFYSYYGHLSEWLVTEGQSVAKREPIGVEGGDPDDPQPGYSTGHHLHFEIRNGSNQHINPIEFLQKGGENEV